MLYSAGAHQKWFQNLLRFQISDLMLLPRYNVSELPSLLHLPGPGTLHPMQYPLHILDDDFDVRAHEPGKIH